MAKRIVDEQKGVRALWGDLAINELLELPAFWYLYKGTEGRFLADTNTRINQATVKRCGDRGLAKTIKGANGEEINQRESLTRQISDAYLNSQNSKEWALRAPFPTLGLVARFIKKLATPITWPISRIFPAAPKPPDLRKGVTPSLINGLVWFLRKVGVGPTYKYDPKTFEAVADTVLGKVIKYEDQPIFKRVRKEIEVERKVTRNGKIEIIKEKKWRYVKEEVGVKKVPVKYTKADGVESKLVGKNKYTYENIECGNGDDDSGSATPSGELSEAEVPTWEDEAATEAAANAVNQIITLFLPEDEPLYSPEPQTSNPYYAHQLARGASTLSGQAAVTVKQSEENGLFSQLSTMAQGVGHFLFGASTVQTPMGVQAAPTPLSSTPPVLAPAIR